MDRIVLYHIVLLWIAISMAAILLKTRKCILRKGIRTAIIVIAAILLVASLAALLFMDAILLGIIGPAPN